MLTVSDNGGRSFEPIPAGTYAAVCNMLVDLGMQKNETYNNISRKVLIGWQLPDETIEINGENQPRITSKRYTMSLSESANLRADLAAWRGREFTPQELAAFDLRNIVGAPCLINIIHKDVNGRKYESISSIMALPKGMQKPQMIGEATVFDLDESPLEDVDKLPKWIADIIKKSETYTARCTSAPPKFEETDVDDAELPF